MTLVDAVLRTAGATELNQLAGLTDEKRRALASGLYKIGADKVPLEQWNALLVAFGLAQQSDANHARAMLIRYLATPQGEADHGGAVSMGAETAQRHDTEKAATVPVRTSTPSAASSTKKANVGVEKKEGHSKTKVSDEKVTESKKDVSAAKKEKSLFVKVWNVFTTILVMCVVVLACALVGVRLIGMQVFTVLSGSMEPVYHVGSLIYVKDVDPFTLEIGDDITFMLDEDTVATHRIVGIVPDEEDPDTIRFRTKGVANEQEDGGLVHYRNVVGQPVFTIPYLGYLASYIQEPPGTFVAIAAGAVLMLLVFLPDLFASDDEDTEPKSKKKKTVG